MRIEFSGITKRFAARTVLDDVTLEARAGELLAILGPSGSGKSTLLGILAGLVTPESGRVKLGERVANDPAVRIAPRDRSIGMVFQELALWPHMTVEQHLRFVAPGADPKEILERLELSARARARPATLSGGEAQRVALARALAGKPKILLLDEPLGALDRRLRRDLESLVQRTHRSFGTTTLYVTHDYEEAMRLADRVAVVVEGKIRQLGTPQELYEHPGDEVVARLTGPASPWPSPDGRIMWVRPERLHVSEDASGSGKVRAARYLGGRWEIEVEMDGTVLLAYSPRPTSGRVNVTLRG